MEDLAIRDMVPSSINCAYWKPHGLDIFNKAFEYYGASVNMVTRYPLCGDLRWRLGRRVNLESRSCSDMRLSLLGRAVKYQESKIIKFLLKKGANPNIGLLYINRTPDWRGQETSDICHPCKEVFALELVVQSHDSYY